jgi:hypothetical protein
MAAPNYTAEVNATVPYEARSEQDDRGSGEADRGPGQIPSIGLPSLDEP